MSEAFVINTQKKNITVVVPQTCPRIVRYTGEKLVDFLNNTGFVTAVLAEENAEPAEEEILIGCTERFGEISLKKNFYRIEVSGGKIIINGENEEALAGGANKLIHLYKNAEKEGHPLEIEGVIENEFVPEIDDYKLVWHDEFDGAELDRSLWVSQSKPYVTKSCLGTDCFAVKAENSEVRDGNAVVWGHRDPKTNNFYHGQICTRGTHRFLYGCMEIRAKLADLPGANALWFVSSNPSSGEGPHAEIDLLEDFAWSDAFNANIHRWGNNVNKDTGEEKRHTSLDGHPVYGKQKHYTCPEGTEPLRNDYHLYTLQWDRHKMRFCVDGKAFFTYDIDHDTDGFGVAAFHRPLYTLMSATMGPNRYSAPWKEGDPDRVELLIDYIRLYQRQSDDGYSIETKTV